MLSGLVVLSSLAAAPITLEEVRAASRQNLDAIRAELDVSRASEGVRLARSAIFPQVGLSFSAGGIFAGPQRIFGTIPQSDGTFAQLAVETPGFTQGQFNLSLTVNQLLYDGGRWWNQIALSGAQEQAAKGQLAEQQLASELEAVRRFYQLVKAQLALEVFSATAARSREQVSRAQSLFDAGRGSRAAVFDAMTNLANDEISVARQRQSIGVARLALLQWLGRPDAEVEAAPPGDLAAPGSPVPLAQALETAQGKRPLVKQLQDTIRAADLGVDVGWANHLPTVSAFGTYARSSPTADPFFTDPSKQNSLQVGASLKLNLFSGFAYDAQIAQARVEARRARAAEHQALVDLEAELRRAHDALRVEAEVLGVSQSSQVIAEQQLKLEEERFSAGAGSSLEVRNAQIKFTQAQLAVLSGRADVAVARAALERTMGGAVP
jgi:outer membrane protein TolC